MFFTRQHQVAAQRREALVARSALLRVRLGQEAQALQAPLALADQVRSGWRWLKAHPEWVGVGAAVLVVWRPRRAWRFASRLWGGWRLWQRLRRWQVRQGPLLPPARR